MLCYDYLLLIIWLVYMLFSLVATVCWLFGLLFCFRGLMFCWTDLLCLLLIVVVLLVVCFLICIYLLCCLFGIWFFSSFEVCTLVVKFVCLLVILLACLWISLWVDYGFVLCWVLWFWCGFSVVVINYAVFWLVVWFA